MRILGSVVWWGIQGVEVPVLDVQAALRKVGLDEKYARDPRDRNAFIRAVRVLERDRIVRRIGNETSKAISFQFTREHLAQQRLDYSYEAKVTLDKEHGHVTADDAALKTMVEQKLQHARDHYMSRDLTALIQRIFRQEADLLPLRDKGAVYFVPEQYREIVDKVRVLLAEFNVVLDSLTVPDADNGKATIFRAFSEDVKTHIDKLNGEVKALHEAKAGGEDIHGRSVTMRLRRVKKLRDRVQVYEALLEQTAERTKAALRSSKQRLEALLSLDADADGE